jgi:hypothetical protein
MSHKIHKILILFKHNNMDKQISFVIPIHPPHYKYVSFLDNLTDAAEFTIFFVLTTTNEKVCLISHIHNYTTTGFKNIRYIVLEEDPEIANHITQFNHRDKGIINMKKLYALHYLSKNAEYTKFDYIAVIDSEIKFINTKNIYNKFKSYCDKKQVIAGNTTIRNNIHSFLDNIHSHSIKHFNSKDIDKINKETNNGKYYFWYSDINVYDRKIVPEFLSYIEFDNLSKFIPKISFWSFDYVIYYYYCIAFHNYKILCMEDYGIERQWSLEAASYKVYKQVIDKMDYTSNIVISNCYYKNKNLFVSDDNEPLLIYNLNDGRYNNIYDRKVDYLDN